jgi:catechol 2,3-dioxygenase-like lactoylglutathione lyase family enzyme
MSKLFGPVRQMGYVVRDIEAALRHWTEVLRVGPFFYFERVPLVDFRYRSEPSDCVCSAALAQCGPVQIELIQQRNDAPSMYRDFLAAGHEGLQHIAFWSDAERFDAALQRAQQAGFTVIHSGASVDATCRFVYFAEQGHPGTAIELSCVTAAKAEVFRKVAEAAEHWDGRDPVRRLDPA